MIIAKLHIPDGFINIPISALFGIISIALIAISLRRAGAVLDDRTTPLAGLTAVFIFAAQMINFPVAAGTSGHLLGAALATALVGPHAATLALTVVLGVQALLFADGGLSALGLNIFNISILAVWVSHFLFKSLQKIFSKSKFGVTVAATVAAYISVPVAAIGFSIQYALGGTGTISATTVTSAMVGTHLLIGLGEALITFITISSILTTRSDLVYGYKPNLEVRG
ncbi:MAG: energy-coupling factor ABC transporter permease [Candidatus Nanopelagicaceae bacterium]|jgi:cobalamin biosynthesis protein CbiM